MNSISYNKNLSPFYANVSYKIMTDYQIFISVTTGNATDPFSTEPF